MQSRQNKMKTIEDKDNFLLNRKEVKVLVDSKKNPTYKEAEEILIKEFDSSNDCIVVRRVKGKFGRNTFLISGFVYNSKEDKEKIEVLPKKGEGSEKSEEESSEQAEEEKPEKKEESKEDNKPEQKEETKDNKDQKKEEPKQDKKEETKE